MEKKKESDDIANKWPEGFFEEVVGALKGPFEIPEDTPADMDDVIAAWERSDRTKRLSK
jgi:hypothetical protein